MSDEQIRDLLAVGVTDAQEGDVDQVVARALAAARDERRRRRIGGGAVVAGLLAASVAGALWLPKVLDTDTPAPADTGGLTSSLPTAPEAAPTEGVPVTMTFARGKDAKVANDGTARRAGTGDLTGNWWRVAGTGTDLDLSFDGTSLVVKAGCYQMTRPAHLSTGGHHLEVGPTVEWLDGSDAADCDTSWNRERLDSLLEGEPTLSVSGDALLLSGRDVADRSFGSWVPAAMSLTSKDGVTWRAAPATTGVTPVELPDGAELQLEAERSDEGLDSLSAITMRTSQGCTRRLPVSLRSDGVVIPRGGWAEDAACPEGQAVVPDGDVGMLLLALPSLSLDGDTMVLSGTVPELLLLRPDQTTGTVAPVSPTSEGAADDVPTTQASTPPVEPTADGDVQLPLMAPHMVLSFAAEGADDASGPVVPATSEALQGRLWWLRTWRDEPTATLHHEGLTYDGTTLQIRACGLQVDATARLDAGVVRAESVVVTPNPDPGASCVYSSALLAEDWKQILDGSPTLYVRGDTLVLDWTSAAAEPGTQVDLALRRSDATDPQTGVTRPVTMADLEAEWVAVPDAEQTLGGGTYLQAPEGTGLRYDGVTLSVTSGCLSLTAQEVWLGPVQSDARPMLLGLPEVATAPCDVVPAGAREVEGLLTSAPMAWISGDYLIISGQAASSR